MPKKVKEARIEIVKSNRLREGDRILYSNIKCKVTNIEGNGNVSFLIHDDLLEKRNFMEWYRILESKEVDLCPICFGELKDGKCDCQEGG
jgi:hypothetical protein